jgi:hypothetical protein
LNYLKYIERTPENLQFFLWFKDYQKRFSQLAESEKGLAPEWTAAHADTARKNYRAELKKRLPSHPTEEILKDTDFDESAKAGTHLERNEAVLFDSPIEVASSDGRPSTNGSTLRPMSGTRSVLSGLSQSTESTFRDAGLSKPCKTEYYQMKVPI